MICLWLDVKLAPQLHIIVVEAVVVQPLLALEFQHILLPEAVADIGAAPYIYTLCMPRCWSRTQRARGCCRCSYVQHSYRLYMAFCWSCAQRA